jgi:GNAT superfamily N-acetyltransferase
MIQIRKATMEDVSIIQAFMIEMAMETEGIALNKISLEKGVNAVLSDRAKGFYLLAELDKNIVGSLMITPEWSDWRGCWIWWIQSVFTLPIYRKHGVYKALYDFVKHEVENTNEIGGIRLYVDKTNHTAQKVYNHLGMNGEHYQLFEWMK